MAAILIERPLAGVALVRLNRPEARNALDMEMREDLAAAFVRLADDSSVRCVILTGNDKVFAAGTDLTAFLDARPVDMLKRNVQGLWRPLGEYPRPIVAAISGYALGAGAELAMHADIIIAGQGATLGLPEIRLGLMPSAGGVARLVRAVGKFKAMRLLLTGTIASAEEAEQMGLVSEVVPEGEVEARALKTAEAIAAMPPLAAEQIKEALLSGQDASLETALALERKSFQLLFSTDDQKEGTRAFLEKRKPSFTGQ